MTDIVERLESHMGLADIQNVLSDCREAAREIERLRALTAPQLHQHGGGVETVDVPKAALDWLFGEGPDASGHWFGDCQYHPKHGAFWWRPAFRAMLSEALAQQPLSVPAWQPIETAPKDKTAVIIAVPTKERNDFIIGEAYFDPGMSSDDGDWWWAGTSHGDYYSSPISDCNHHEPQFWQNLPTAPAHPTQSDVSCSRAREGGTEE